MYNFKTSKLKNNKIIQQAFCTQIFDRLSQVGYYDMNPFLRKPKIGRDTVAANLKMQNSPLEPLFRKVYPKSLEAAEEKLLPFLEEIGSERIFSDYENYALVLYIYCSINLIIERGTFTKNLLEVWDEEWSEDSLEEDWPDYRLSNGIIYDHNTIHLEIIGSINQYISLLEAPFYQNCKVFYRGHSNVSFRLIPSVFRQTKWLHNEKLMYQELQINCSNELCEMHRHLDILAEMQHYGLPTRLLDITQNPLIALYFACEDTTTRFGEVILLGVNRADIKYPQSDTVAILASLPLFTYNKQKKFYSLSTNSGLGEAQFNSQIENLIQEVRIERPGFIGKVKKEDLRKSFIVMPSRNNRRIEKQEGAFIICGLLDEVYGNGKTNSIDQLRIQDEDGKKIVCVVHNKAELLRQLDSLGINKSKIYPEIDDVADYLKNHVEEL